MKPFNLEEAKAGKPVVTRDGKDVRILAFDRKGNMPIVGLITDEEFEIAYYWSENGKSSVDFDSECDLFMKSEKKEGWVNVYQGYPDGTHNVKGVFQNEHYAISYGKNTDGYVTTVKVEWEE